MLLSRTDDRDPTLSAHLTKRWKSLSFRSWWRILSWIPRLFALTRVSAYIWSEGSVNSMVISPHQPPLLQAAKLYQVRNDAIRVCTSLGLGWQSTFH